MRNIKFYSIVLLISLIILLLEVFVFKIKGAFGLTICLISIYLIIGTIIRLLIMSGIISKKNSEKIDILFF